MRLDTKFLRLVITITGVIIGVAVVVAVQVATLTAFITFGSVVVLLGVLVVALLYLINIYLPRMKAERQRQKRRDGEIIQARIEGHRKELVFKTAADLLSGDVVRIQNLFEKIRSGSVMQYYEVERPAVEVFAECISYLFSEYYKYDQGASERNKDIFEKNVIEMMHGLEAELKLKLSEIIVIGINDRQTFFRHNLNQKDKISVGYKDLGTVKVEKEVEVSEYIDTSGGRTNDYSGHFESHIEKQVVEETLIEEIFEWRHNDDRDEFLKKEIERLEKFNQAINRVGFK